MQFEMQLFNDVENSDVTFENEGNESVEIPAEKHAAQNQPEEVSEKVDGEENFENVKISYNQHKKTLDEKSEIEKQLEEYKKRFGDLNAKQTPVENIINSPDSRQNDLPEDFYQDKQKTPPQPKYFTADDAQQIDDIVTQKAMQMTGLTQEDIDSLDYLDDDDPKIRIWNYARELAKIDTYNQIVAMQQAQAQEEYRRNMLLNQSTTDFNSYVEQQKEAENFSALQQFAGTEFFDAQSPVEQQIILEANTRLEKGVATPVDYVVVRDYFTRAKTAFDAKNQKMQTAPPKPKQSKPQFPRTDKVNGVAGNGGGISNAALSEMVRNTAWEKIPQQYKDILLNATT